MNGRLHSSLWMLVMLVALLASHATARNAGKELRKFTGARTKVVWYQQIKGDDDVFARGTRNCLMGFDSDDGKGERVILDEPANYHRPMITPKGDRIVFTDFPNKDVLVVNWDGTGLKKLRDGIGAAVWMDDDGVEWVYMVRRETEDYQGFPVRRFQIDNPEVMEVMWDKTDVTWFNFQLSLDGSHVSGQFPHPRAGYAVLPNGKFRHLADGCWTAMSPDNSYRVWAFEGNHRNVRMFQPVRGKDWRVDLSGAPGLDGYEVYHPRWSNHPRFMTMTGPYREGEKGKNLIAAGGNGVEVYIGRFSDGFHRIEEWFQLTDNEKPDFFPDVWIENGRKASQDAD